MSFSLSKASRELIHLQRRTTVLGPLETKKSGHEAELSSDEARFDSDKEARLRSKLAQAQQYEATSTDLVEQALRRGIRLQHPLPIPRQVSHFTLKHVVLDH